MNSSNPDQAPAENKPYARPGIRFLLGFGGLLMSVGLLYLLSLSVDVDRILSQVRNIDPLYLFLAITGVWAGLLFGAVRLRIIYSDLSDRRQREALELPTGALPDGVPGRPSVRVLFSINIVGIFLGHCMPHAMLAEATRIGFAAVLLSKAVIQTIEAFLHERIVALLGLLLAGLALLPFQWILVEQSNVIYLQGSILSVGVAILALSGLALRITALDKIRFLDRLVRTLDRFWSYMRSSRTAFLHALVTLGIAVSFSLVLWSVAKGLNFELSFLAALSFSPILLLATTLPLTYVGWGTREAVAAVTIGQILSGGVEDGIAVSIGVGIAILLASLPGAFVWLISFVGRRST